MGYLQPVLKAVRQLWTQIFFISTFTTFQRLQTMLAIHGLQFRFFFGKFFMYKNCNPERCYKKSVTENKIKVKTLLIGSISYLLLV